MAFERGIVPEDWRSAVIFPLVVVNRVCRVTWALIHDEQVGFRAGRGSVDQTFTLKQTGEKALEKKRRVYVGFIEL